MRHVGAYCSRPRISLYPEGGCDCIRAPQPRCMKTFLLTLSLALLAGLTPALAAGAESSWGSEELWDLFRFGRLQAVKAAVVKNPKLINMHDPSNQMTVLHGAARFGTPDLILFFIQKGADVNAVEYNKFTPLHDASSGANAKMLIQHGADTTKKDAWGNTPLQKIAEDIYNHPKDPTYPDICAGMLEAGAKLDILSALYLGKRDDVKRMVAADPAILRDHENGLSLWHNNTPLGIAAQSGDKELVELFLKNGALVDGVTSLPMTGTMTPLTNALGAGHLDVAEVLLKAGASLNVTLGGNENPNLTLLQWADTQSNPQIKELIHRYAEARAKEKP